MNELHVDLESRSRVNLLRAGAHEYWEDESTEVLCMAWRFGDGDIEAWVPGEGPFPGEVNRHIREGGLIWAHNAAFERLAFWNVLAPDHGAARPMLEQFRCSAAVARTNGLPGALADVPRALELPHRKNPRGQELIRLLCVPQGVTAKDQRAFWPEGDFQEDPALLEEMIGYCMDDVLAESEFLFYLRELSAEEWTEYHTQERINDRGMAIDRELCRLALPYAELETAQLNARNYALTGLAKIRSSAMAEWVWDLLPADLMELMTREDGKLSLAKDIVTDLLATDGLPGKVREVLELRQQVSKSSVAKFRTMLNHSELTGRVRGAYLFSGAPSTGRVAARGLNLQNFTRGCMEDPEAVLRAMREQVPMEDTMSVLSRMLRPALIAEKGNVLLWGDLASIEARVMPWLTHSRGGDAVLDIFRECDEDSDLPDIYERTAEGFDGTRQEGKTLSLACQYQGGLGAFHAMARIYGVSATDRVAEHLIKRWRRDNVWATRFWKELQTAAEDALRYPERWHEVGRVALAFSPDIMAGTLWLLLPSGRRLAYPRIEVKYVEGRYSLRREITAIKGALKPKVGEPWPRQHLYGGRFAAAATQGTAADLLRSMMVKMGQVGGVNVVGSTHDELICEVGESELGVATRRLSRGMQEGPAWVEGLPLVAEMKGGKRYYK